MTKVQLYKVGYYTDEWGMSIISPCLIPDDSGFAVKFEDYCKLEAENERLERNLSTTEQTMREYQELAAKRLEEIDRLKTLEESALKVCAELDSIVMVMPYDYLDPPDGGNVPMSEQISRMWSEVKELRAELTKYRDAPVVAWVEVVDSYEGPYHFNGEKLLNVGKHKLIVKPGEEK